MLCREQLLSNPLDEFLKAEGMKERGVVLKIFTPFMTTVGQPWDLGSLSGRALLTARP